MSELTPAQRAAVAILPKISSTLSFFGSSAILAECFYFDRSRLQRAHHRILCVMASIDLLESLWNFASAWALPEDSEYLYAAGSGSSCKAQGFFLQLSVSSILLNVFLSWYFLLVIRYSWSEEKIKSKAEPWIYVISLLWGFGTSIAGLPLNLYQPNGRWCYIGRDKQDTNNFKFYLWAFLFWPIIVCSLMIVVNTSLLIVTVRNIENASKKYLSDFYEASALKKKGNTRTKTRFWKTLRRGKENGGNRQNGDTERARRMAELKRKLEEVKAKNAAAPSANIQIRDTASVLQLRAKKKNTKTKELPNDHYLQDTDESCINKNCDLRNDARSDKVSSGDSRIGGSIAFEEEGRVDRDLFRRQSTSLKRKEKKTKRKKRSKTRIVSEQSVYYLLAFFLSIGWIINNLCFHLFVKKPAPYIFLVGQVFFDPLQGFLNFLVYLRPSFIAHRRHNPQLTRLQCCIALITHQETPGEDIETEAKQEIEELKKASVIYKNSSRLKLDNAEEWKKASVIYKNSSRLKLDNADMIMRVPVNLRSAIIDEELVEEDETRLQGLVAPV